MKHTRPGDPIHAVTYRVTMTVGETAPGRIAGADLEKLVRLHDGWQPILSVSGLIEPVFTQIVTRLETEMMEQRIDVQLPFDDH